MRVLLATNHPIARAAARPALLAHPDVHELLDASIELRGLEQVDVDLVVVEQSVDRVSTTGLARIAAICPAARVVAMALADGDEYSWVMLRRARDGYQVDAMGVSTIGAMLARATRPVAPAA